MSQIIPDQRELSYSIGQEEMPVLRQTIGANVREVAERHPHSPAIIETTTGRRWTYAEVVAGAERVARALMGAGFAPGDRVGMWSPNCAEWTLLQYGSAMAGVILVNLNPAYRRHELGYVVTQCQMSGLVVAPPDERADPPALARAVAAEAPALRTLVMLPTPGEITDDSYHHARPGSTDRGETAGGELEEVTWSTFLDGADRVSDDGLAQRSASLQPDDPINLQYTSGTTGFPKGVTLTHLNLLNNGFHIGELLGYTAQDAVVIPVPFFHCFGMVIGNLAALSHGTATVIPARSFDATATLEAVQQTGATSLYGVPTMFITELSLPDVADYDLSTLRTGVMAGSTCPMEVMRKVIEKMNMSEVAICYGMTETSPVSTMTRTDDSLERRTQTVGRTMPGLETKIIDPTTGATLPRGATGELCTRGYAVMAGYWDEEEKTADAIDAEGWMHTGDLASMDEDAYVRIDGRIKDVVIRGGENISPREVEEFLYTHPAIRDVQVIGVPDERYGEELMACIILNDGAEPVTAEQLHEFSTGQIAHFKIPQHVRIMTAFPMTVSGKVRKVEMREEAAAELARSPRN